MTVQRISPELEEGKLYSMAPDWVRRMVHWYEMPLEEAQQLYAEREAEVEAHNARQRDENR